MKRIAYDLSPLYSSYLSGIPRYCQELFPHLLQAHPGYEYITFGKPFSSSIQHLKPNLSDHSIGLSPYILSLMLRIHQADLMICNYGILPTRRTCPGLLLIYDIIPLLYPEFASHQGMIGYFKEILPLALQHTDGIITISEASKKDIATHYNYPQERNFVTPLGVSSDFYRDQLSSISGSCSIPPQPYLLNVSTLEPRKNHLQLIHAYDLFRQNHPQEKLHLVLVGHLGWGYEPILARINDSPYAADIIHFKQADDLLLKNLYKNASIFIYPSLYEGFGLPILEAMAAGIPALISETSSMPEVGADTVTYFNPTDVESLVHNLEKLYYDTAYQQHCSQKGMQRAQLFTWQKTAQATTHAIECYLN